MKRIITICAAFLMAASVFAQAPQKMSYQAVIRNSSNALVTNQAVGMRISILQGSSTGTALYIETQTPTTNANGLASIEIGGGTVVSGNFSTIDWANGPYFVKTETDPTGGTNYSIMGTSQLMSVPYALFASSVSSNGGASQWVNSSNQWSPSGSSIYYNSGYVGIGISSNVNYPLVVGGITKVTDNVGSAPDEFIIFPETNNNKIRLVGSYYNSGTYPDFSFELGGTPRMFMQASSGNIGIGTTNPQRTLHVSSVMRLEPIATAPASPAKGDMYFDSTLNKLRVYDGTTWQNCW